MADYIPIPVEEARRLAERFNRSMVVILAYDPSSARTHVVTYGTTPQEKEIAANLGVRCAQVVGCDLAKAELYEDFRFVDQAKRAAAIDVLKKACKAAHYCLSSLIAVRDGVPNESLERLRDTLQEALEADVPVLTPGVQS